MPYLSKVENGEELPTHKCTTVSSYIKINLFTVSWQKFMLETNSYPKSYKFYLDLC